MLLSSHELACHTTHMRNDKGEESEATACCHASLSLLLERTYNLEARICDRNWTLVPAPQGRTSSTVAYQGHRMHLPATPGGIDGYDR